MSERAQAKPHGPPAALSPETHQRAASHPDTSVWVNASAGSGKTTVLTNRVTRLLLKGVPPQRILCLTFTRAAAAEMANRIAGKLGHWATCRDNELSESIADLQGAPPTERQMTEARRLFARMLACPGGMRIRTIHAFCQEILRRFPVEAGLPPHFAVIEEADARALIEEAQADLLRAAADAPGSPLARALGLLAGDLGEHGFGEAMASVISERARLAAAIHAAGNIEILIKRLKALLSLAPDETEANIRRGAVDDAAMPRDELLRSARRLLEGSKTYAARGAKMLAWLALPPDGRATKFEDYCRCFLKEDGAAYQNFANKDLLDTYSDLGPALEREAARLQSACERIEAARIAETTAAVLTLGAELLRRYGARKAAQAALDYDDLIIRADGLLRRPGIAPWVLYKLDNGLDHILVDEAQDTSRAQWSIIAALADEFFAGSGARGEKDDRTLFVVGDEKQSIFSFQRADPEAFAVMRGYFARRIADAEKAYDEVPMQTSFRSAPAILRAVDHVFAPPHVYAGVSAEAVRHQASDREKTGRVEVWPLQPNPKAGKDAAAAWTLPLDYEDEHDPQAELARAIAARIKHWLEAKETLPGFDRPIRAGDVMILLRRRGRFADLMVRALKKQDVPVTGVDRMRLVRQLPVMDLLALLQFALLPEDDLNLACVLRGPLLNLSEEQLMELAIGRAGTLWQSLAAKARGNPAFAAARDYLSGWLGAADFMTPFAMLARLLNEACPGSDVSGRRALWARLGPDALDPIDELLNAAQNFSRRHAPSLQAFLHWLTATEAEIKRELDQGEDQVRIMTVHAAKGLEAPVVFLPDTTGVPRANDIAKFLWNDDDTPFYAARRSATGVVKQLRDKARRKQMEEYRRLLYVALTRAQNRLYIGGWEPARDAADSGGSWYNLVADALKPPHEEGAGDRGPGKEEPIIAFADPDLRKPKKKTSAPEKPIAVTTLPEWARRNAAPEPALSQPLAPSRLAQEPAAAPPGIHFARGRIMHRLLQSLPDIADAKRAAAAARFLAHPQFNLTPEQRDEIAREALKLLRDPAHAPLFGPSSRAEAPLAGYVDGQAFSGQVDRLCLRGDEVWIVDYKTNRPPPENAAAAPEAYRLQLAAYRALLRQIYPDKAIRCFLLWTCGPRLMELPDAVLSASGTTA